MVDTKYSAKHSYDAGISRELYEAERFKGILGSYRYRREQAAVSALVHQLPRGIVVLDCPCGNGRWWPLLSTRAERIVAVDVSPGMRQLAAVEAKKWDVEIEVRDGDAERLDLPDASVDYTFSHALTKHLPIPVQYKVLSEFARVSRRGVICSFGVFSHVTYEFWRWRKLTESYPTFIEEVNWMAMAAGLTIREMRKCTTPLGVEHTVFFEKKV
jgi:ubiquinone/menaquinone biosynthesis C-methylase UbiE